MLNWLKKRAMEAPGEAATAAAEGYKLNVGGGKGHPRLPGWQIVDLREGVDVQMDISAAPLPFPDNSVLYIFTSHTLEHILPQKLGFVLDEFHRVLKPAHEGGLLRIAVPDIEKACRAYLDKNLEFFRQSELTPFDREAPLGGMLMSWFYSTSSFGHGHVHCFDCEYLKYWLNKYGFDRAQQSAYRESQAAELRGDGFDRHPGESLFVEAQKSR